MCLCRGVGDQCFGGPSCSHLGHNLSLRGCRFLVGVLSEVIFLSHLSHLSLTVGLLGH